MYPQDFLAGVIKEVRDCVENMDADIVACHTVMCGEDGEAAARALSGLDFDVIIANFVSWHITPYVMQILKNYRGTPVLVWGIGGKTDAGGKLHSPAAAAGVTALVPVLKEMGYSYKVICQKPDEPLREKEAAGFLRVAAAARKIRSARIGLVGYADMGLYTCAYDKLAVFDKLGIDIEDYFTYEITAKMDAVTREELDGVLTGIKKNMAFENNISDAILEKAARLYCAMKGKADSRDLDAISIKCVTGVTRYLGFNPCLAQSMLASKDLSVICECDAYGLITSVILSSLSGQCAAFMENYEVFDDSVLVGVCGFIPGDFTEGGVKIRSANLGGDFGGIGNVSKVKAGTVTFARFYQSGGAFKLFISKGEALPNPKWTELGWEEPTPDFPSVRLKLEIPVQKYLENVMGQHIIMVYGDWTGQLKDLCSILRIETSG
jgi:L-fucose isomerase-like protein